VLFKSKSQRITEESTAFLRQASDLFFQKADTTNSLRLAQIALEGYRKVACLQGEIDALHILGRIEQQLGNDDRATDFYNEEIAKAQPIRHLEGIARANHEKALIAFKNNDFIKAENGLRFSFRCYLNNHDERKAQFAINDLNRIAESALLSPAQFIPTISNDDTVIGHPPPEDYLSVRALAILSEFSPDRIYFRKRLIQRALVLHKYQGLFRYALYDVQRAADDRFTIRVAQTLLAQKPRVNYRPENVQAVTLNAKHEESNLYKTPETAAQNIEELLALLREEDQEGPFVYRGQTKDYPGPLLPSGFRGIIDGNDVCLDKSSPHYSFSIRGCGQKFFGEYNQNFLQSLSNVLRDIPANEIPAASAVYQKALKNPFAILAQHKNWLEKNQLLRWDDALNLTLTPAEMELYLKFAAKWRPFIDNYHRRVIRTGGFFRPFGYLLGTTLAQQYGFSSEGVDATKSIDAAAFFATHNSKSGYSALEEKGNIGVMYRFPYKPNDIHTRNLSDYNYYTLPSIIDLQDVLCRFERKGLDSEDAINCFDCYYGAVHLDGLKDEDLFFLPEGALSSSRVSRQGAVIILPDELRKDREGAEPNADGIKFPEFRYIEDISQRQGVEKFFFKQTGEIPDLLKIDPEYYWPRNDTLLEIIVALITAVYPMMRFSGAMAHRLDLIDGGYDKGGFLKVCEAIALKHKIVLYDYTQLLGAKSGNLIF
jgi:hypothetical protein